MTGMLPASPKQLLIIMPKQGGAGSTRMMENYDHTNSNSRDCTCDKCHFLLAGYSCLQIHDPQVYRAVPPPSPKTAALPAGRLTSIYDYTNSTCSKCYCDIDNCGLLLAGYIVYGCLPCRYAGQQQPQRNGQRSDRLHFQRVISRN
uniref:Uncharacterized protein n=1 Tax=Oryza nivara TaxID=4536 RepID=A0A0E0HM41_ORYNI